MHPLEREIRVLLERSEAGSVTETMLNRLRYILGLIVIAEVETADMPVFADLRGERVRVSRTERFRTCSDLCRRALRAAERKMSSSVTSSRFSNTPAGSMCKAKPDKD